MPAGKGCSDRNSRAAVETRDLPREIPGGSATGRTVLAALCCLLIALPFLATHFPPITDLPQHSAQIRLFLDTIRNPAGSPYLIQWITPYSLSYLAIGGSWALFGAENAGRIAMLVIALSWVISIHWVAHLRERSSAAATVVSVFALNHILYWGFYSFAIGWPAFVIWFVLCSRERRQAFSLKEAVIWTAAGLLLYMSHVLWFGAGVAWLIISGTVCRRDLKATSLRLAYLFPLFVAVWFWYPVFSSSTMATPTQWVSTPISRLQFSWLSDAALGGMRGLAEPVVFGVAIAWVLAGLVQNRGDLKNRIDPDMLLAAAMFLILFMFLPDKYMNTIRFGQRWMPGAMIFLVLGIPAPALRPVVDRTLALAVVAAFCVVTSMNWVGFEKKELSGLRESLDALPASPRVLGLDFIQESQFIRGRPFIQTFAYAQVLKGGSLNFSFAEFSPCLVIYRDTFLRPWTGGLEWFPRRVRETDLDFFDFALIGASDDMHRFWAKQPRLRPVTERGRWRLYKIFPHPM